MPKIRKSVARQSRRDERGRMRDDSRLHASVDRSMPIQREQRRREPVVPLTAGQKRYDAAFKSSDIIFGIGPAGTGKTWFAVQRAAEALNAGEIKKIMVTRPAVEVERGMGFLPGELDEKYAPYLIPLEEAFIEAFGKTKYEYLVKNKIIDARPLAFMRGSTIKDAWLIADEMQNATQTEFKMMLTRIGEGAKFIINGDPRQIDQGIRSGLGDACSRLRTHGQVSVVEFGANEIVRSGLCQDIVERYED